MRGSAARRTGPPRRAQRAVRAAAVRAAAARSSGGAAGVVCRGVAWRGGVGDCRVDAAAAGRHEALAENLERVGREARACEVLVAQDL